MLKSGKQQSIERLFKPFGISVRLSVLIGKWWRISRAGVQLASNSKIAPPTSASGLRGLRRSLARGFEAMFVYLECSDLGFQRGGAHAEFRCGARWAGYLAACFSQRCFDQRFFLGRQHLD